MKLDADRFEVVEGVEKFATYEEAKAYIRGARIGHEMGGWERDMLLPDEPTFECDSNGKWTYNVDIKPEEIK